MPPKTKGYKMSFQELLQHTGGSLDMMESTYSSGATDSKADPDWTRWQKRNFQNDPNRKNQKHVVTSSRPGYGEGTVDDESSWRRTEPVAAAATSSEGQAFGSRDWHPKLGETGGEQARRGRGGKFSWGSKTLNQNRFPTADDVDFLNFRSGGVSSVTSKNREDQKSFSQDYSKIEATFIRQNEDFAYSKKKIDVPVKERIDETSGVTKMELSGEDETQNASDLESSKKQELTHSDGTIKTLLSSEPSKSEQVQKTFPFEPKGTSPLETAQVSTKGHAITSEDTSEKKTVVAPVKLFKPKILQKLEKEKELLEADFLKKMIQEKKTQVTEVQQPQAQTTETSVNAAKFRQAEKKRLHQEKEEKKRLEKLRKNEFEQVYQLECEAIQTIQASLDRFEKAEESLYIQLQEASASQSGCVLESFKILFTSEELQTLVPSLVLAKCMVMASYKLLQTTMDDRSMSDLERMELAQKKTISPFKKTVSYLFEKSKIPNHPVQFLRETQLCLTALNFPRISPGLSLIEAIWDGLYASRCISEKSFHDWYDAFDDNFPGRSNVVFQTLSWFEWLRSAPSEGQENEYHILETGESEDEEENEY